MSIRLFGHYVSVPLLLLIFSEAVIFVGSVYLAGSLRFLSVNFRVVTAIGTSPWVFPRALLYAAVMLGVMAAFGLYGSALGRKDREYYARYLSSFPAGALAMMIVFYVVPASFLGRGIMALSFAFSIMLTALARTVFFRVIGHKALKRRVLVLGSGSRAAGVDALQNKLGSNAGFDLVGFVLCGDQHQGRDKSKLLGDCTVLPELIKRHRIDEIVVGVRDRRNGYLPMSKLLECKLEGISVVDLPTFFERETGSVQINSVSASWMIFSEGFSRTGVRKLIKRAFDIGVSGAMLIVTVPIMLLATLAIWCESGRPILYRQIRVGESGKAFEIMKFRSMRSDAEKDGVARWAQKNDDRITRVGRFLRLTRVDELPQLINVLRGDMSFVGPRPERPPFVNELSRKVPFYGSRHAVRPGITGWAQVQYPYGASIDDAVEKLQFDLYYVKNHTLFLDLVILFQTAQVVLFGKGAR